MNDTYYRITGCPIKTAVAADLHNAPYGPVVASLRRNRPDIIAIPGDIIYGNRWTGGLIVRDQKNVLPFLRECAAIAPTYFSIGNHEKILTREDYSLIRDTGVTLLDNTYVMADGVCIGGLTSAEASRAKHPDLSWLKEFISAPGYHILLCHHPEYYPALPANIELILSGHAHGGQWNFYSIPEHRWRGVFAPDQGILPKYTSGVYDGRLVVSRGLSNPTCVPRILNPTEMVYITGDTHYQTTP